METQNVANSPTDKLPKVPSQLIRVALEDMKRVLAQPDKFKLDMAFWVRHDGDDRPCTVCMAGSVMVGSMGLREEIRKAALKGNRCDVTPGHLATVGVITEQDRNALRALNDYRAGWIQSGMRELSQEPLPEEVVAEIDSIQMKLMVKHGDISGLSFFHPKKHLLAMEDLAAELEKIGL